MKFLLCLLAVAAFGSAAPVTTKYGLIMDAGSTGTRIYVYKWLPVACDELPRLEKLSSHKVKPGLSSFNEKLEEIPTYLSKLLNEAKKDVPETSHGETEIALMATAGLRTFEGDVTESLLDAVREFMGDKTSNPFSFKPQHIKVLSGEEEGVYAWISVNYLLGTFNKRVVDPVGILEMGGGSTQIAFIPDEPIYEGSFRIDLGEKQYDMYSQSYLSYGQDYMMKRIEEHLYKEKGSPVYSHCRLRGDNITQMMADGENVEIIGAWDLSACFHYLRFFTHKDDDEFCHPKPCAIGRVYQPRVGDKEFYAISAFYYAAQAMRAIRDDGVLDMELMFRNTARLCTSKDVNELSKELDINKKYLSANCMMGMYIPVLLTKAYGFNIHTDQIRVAGDINGVSAQWTIGALLDLNTMSRDCHETGESHLELNVKRK